MMSRGFKYFVTSVHARIFLYYTLITNEKRGTDFAPNQFFTLRVRSRRDFEIQYEESKMRFMLTSLYLPAQGHKLPKRIQTRDFTSMFYRTY